MALQLVRLAAVLTLLTAAAALATPPGRLPLALRGLAALLRRDAGGASAGAESRAVSPLRRLLALLLVLLAAGLALI